MKLTELSSSMNDADLKVSRTRLSSSHEDLENFLHEDDDKSNGKSKLRQYTQRLEKEKRMLETDVQMLKEYNASQQLRIQSAERHVKMLETSLTNALNTGNIFQQEKDVVLALQASERERMASDLALLEDAQSRYEDAERARQSATFNLSSLQALGLESSSQNLRASMITTSCNGIHDYDERIEKYKRDIELLHQKLELTTEQAAERQKLAVSLALQEAQLDYSNMVEHMKEEHDQRLLEWRHSEAVRGKEQESALDEDRYSIRLEMKYALQRSQIDDRVSFLQAQAGIRKEMPCSCGHIESDFSIGTLDEVLVRMQLEQIRTRRFEALKKALLIRRAKQNQAALKLFCRWKLQIFKARTMRLSSLQCMHRITQHLNLRKKLSFLNKWREHVKQLRAHTIQSQALLCCNRMIAVERIRHVFDQMTVKQVASCFHRWCQQTCVLAKGSSLCASNIARIKEEDMQSLHQEIKKLHDQLTSSKSEAWRYKRQLLKQFL